MESQPVTLFTYLKGKVADYTVSDNAIESVMLDRGYEKDTAFSGVSVDTRMLCYADLLKYIYLSPNMTKSYSQTNGTWSQKEGATQLSIEDKKKILAEMRRLYCLYGEPENVPSTKSVSTIRMVSHGMKIYK